MKGEKCMEISYDNLFLYMFKNNISKSELAKKTGVSRNTIIKMTKGEPVHLSIIISICTIYNLSLSDVIQEKT
jgi:DNA-binding Xre family transcriptional regulator